jgi:hypothetical protein
MAQAHQGIEIRPIFSGSSPQEPKTPNSMIMVQPAPVAPRSSTISERGLASLSRLERMMQAATQPEAPRAPGPAAMIPLPSQADAVRPGSATRF